MKTLLLAVLAVLFVGISGCSGGSGSGDTVSNPSASKIEGQSCAASSECKSGVCLGGVCHASADKPPSGSAEGPPVSSPPTGGSGSATSAPSATLTTPADYATAVSVDTKIVITFSEEMDAVTITTGDAKSVGTFYLVSLASPETAPIPPGGKSFVQQPVHSGDFYTVEVVRL